MNNDEYNQNDLDEYGANDEFNTTKSTNEDINEVVKASELNEDGDGTKLEENNNNINDNLKNLDKVSSFSTSAAAGMMTAITTAVVAIVGAVTVFNTDLLNTNDVNLSVNSISVLDTSLSYDIDASCNEPLVLSVQNDFYLYQVTLDNGNNTGKITGLTENMNYNFTITYKGLITDSIAYKKVIKTLSPIMVTEFYEVAWECRCAVDGNFHFLMSFDDDFNYWSNFKATLTDDYGNVSNCVFTDDLHQEQQIPVVNYDGNGNELKGTHAILKITCTSIESGSEEEITLYQTDCKI